MLRFQRPFVVVVDYIYWHSPFSKLKLKNLKTVIYNPFQTSNNEPLYATITILWKITTFFKTKIVKQLASFYAYQNFKTICFNRRQILMSASEFNLLQYKCDLAVGKFHCTLMREWKYKKSKYHLSIVMNIVWCHIPPKSIFGTPES